MTSPPGSVVFTKGIWEKGANKEDAASLGTKFRSGKLEGFKGKVKTKKIENASTDGTQYLTDMRFILDNYGVPDTYDVSGKHFDYETYFTL